MRLTPTAWVKVLEAHPHTHSPNHRHYLTILTHALLYDQVPESTKAKDKDDIVRTWNALNVPKANVEAQASAHVVVPGATQAKKSAAKKPQQKKRKRAADSSEDEESDDDDDTCSQDEDMSCDEDGESEGEGGESGDESDCDDDNKRSEPTLTPPPTIHLSESTGKPMT